MTMLEIPSAQLQAGDAAERATERAPPLHADACASLIDHGKKRSNRAAAARVTRAAPRRRPYTAAGLTMTGAPQRP